MKKIFLLLLLPLLCYAQNSDKAQIMKSQQQMFYEAYQNTKQALRVVVIQDSSQTTNWYAVDTSSTNGVDTINFGFTTRKVIIINDMANTDTLYFAKSGAFQTITTLKLVGGEAIVLDVGWTTAYFKTGYTPLGHLTKKKFRLIAY